MEWIADPQIWISLLTLTALEVVLGIDNIIFISILAGKLPAERQDRARKTGLMLALVTRILLLMSISWLMSLRSEEHTSELQSRENLVCRLLLEKKKNQQSYKKQSVEQT